MRTAAFCLRLLLAATVLVGPAPVVAGPQGTDEASASSPAMTTEAPAAMPCHGQAAEHAPATPLAEDPRDAAGVSHRHDRHPGDCCGDDRRCHCLAAHVPALTASPLTLPPMRFADAPDAAPASAFVSAHQDTPQRPPIA